MISLFVICYILVGIGYSISFNPSNPFMLIFRMIIWPVYLGYRIAKL